jgi:hypothetical protein
MSLPSCEKWCGEDEHAQHCYVTAIAISIEFWLLVAGAVASQWWTVLQ